MSKSQLLDVRNPKSAGDEHREPLLGSSTENDDDYPVGAPVATRPSPPPRRQSSITRPPPPGLPRIPRTPNRVRFDIAERQSSEHELRNVVVSCRGMVQQKVEEEEEEAEEEGEGDDYFSSRGGNRTGQQAPLLTDIEAPSVTVANSRLDSQVEDLLDNPRPKSGLMSAFMNMANSIM